MKNLSKTNVIKTTLLLTGLLGFGCTKPAPTEAPAARSKATSQADPLTDLPLTIEVSPDALPEGQMMPASSVFDGFGCSGGNTSPGISWSQGPAGTKSYAVMMYDPDAPTGVGFHHWWLANLPPHVTELAAGVGASDGVLPSGAVQGRNDYGTSFYGGPCPPEGRTHRYRFTVWALDVDALPVDADTSPVVARFMIRQHAIAAGRFERRFGR